MRLALLASPTAPGQNAARLLRKRYHWVQVDQADTLVALGGDGFMLQVLHDMLAGRMLTGQMAGGGRVLPVFGMNRGTVGFLMNDWRADALTERIAGAKAFAVTPLRMDVTTMAGETVSHPAINEVSLLRETRQTAKIEVSVDGRVAIPELVCDGVLVATPAGSTAYNLSAKGPILPLASSMMALTPISPFRPRRWGGAILPDSTRVGFRILTPEHRPVSAVADQIEIRNVAHVGVGIDRTRTLTLMFDPNHALDERIAMEQFVS